jgi:hypothetical protein
MEEEMMDVIGWIKGKLHMYKAENERAGSELTPEGQRFMVKGAREGSRERLVFVDEHGRIIDKNTGNRMGVSPHRPTIFPSVEGHTHVSGPDRFSSQDVWSFLRNGTRKSYLYTHAGSVHVMERTPQTDSRLKENVRSGEVGNLIRSARRGEGADMGTLSPLFAIKYSSFRWR